ncbi:hypothetical protein PV10_02981 [Exophiala mesophila]|uniref:BTB domain-containing protein n=1 Tax=Exophiala mesophila TaxID=212818 RepID=A0A0D1Y3R6_EXOME|nr:uncharacterized protein PV10_02981 [Exophiala mesophila]KIV95311.1 hypothetical protein PV10_02981 [Exophiala mesophila]
MTTVNIDPDGDLIIKIGWKKLRVSSHVLCLASPVFKVMLRSNFIEGVTAENSASNPKRITLPDDDQAAFKTLCHVLHFQLDSVPQRLDIDSLQELATLCDKYQVITPMLNCATLWVCELASDSDIETMVRLLIIAIDFDLPDAFNKVSRSLLRTHCGDVESLQDYLAQYAPTDATVLDAFKDACKRLVSEIRGVIFNQISDLARGSCKICQRQAGFVLRFVQERPVLPGGYLSPWDFNLAVDELEGMDRLELCHDLDCDCKAEGEAMGFVHRLKMQMKRTLKTHGLCLDCVKRPKTTQTKDSERTCRVRNCLHFTTLSLWK